MNVGGRVLVIERPESAEALIDEEAFARNEFLPYWAELWPSAVALARRAIESDLAGRHVLEVGCGLGLPAVAAAHAGAFVLATDWAGDALTFVARNAARNGVRVQTALLAWQHPEALASRRFDIVLGADLLYEERNAVPLLGVLDRVLAREGFALLVDPGRRHAPAFLETARRAGWAIDSSPAEEVPQGAVHRLWRERP